MAAHLDPAAVDPHQLVAALLTVGYQVAGPRVLGGFIRLARPGEEPPRGSLTIPQDRAMGDYTALMTCVIRDLEDVAQRGADAAAVLALLTGADAPGREPV